MMIAPPSPKEVPDGSTEEVFGPKAHFEGMFLTGVDYDGVAVCDSAVVADRVRFNHSGNEWEGVSAEASEHPLDVLGFVC